MTKKDYIKIAKILQKYVNGDFYYLERSIPLGKIIIDFEAMLEEDNRKFNRFEFEKMIFSQSTVVGGREIKGTK